MDYRVVFAPQVEEQLIALYQYIATEATPQTALNYTENIVEFCESLSHFPERGNRRDDILLRLRITHYRKRATIAFVVVSDTLTVLGIWYGGQNYEAVLSEKKGD